MQQNHLNLTPRFKMAFVTVSVLIIALFFYFLNHYAPEQKQVIQKTIAIDPRGNGDLIRKIADENQIEENNREILAGERQGDASNSAEEFHEEKLAVKSAELPASGQSISIEDKKDAAAQSAISVYGNEAPNLVQEKPITATGDYSQSAIPHAKGDSSFLESSSEAIKTHINDLPHQPVTRYEIKAGSLIPAILVTSINSDLPGKITARISQNVYDTVTGNYLLVPQGTALLGTYDANITYGQQRALVVWQRMIFPNGSSMQLEGQPGVDLVGHAGLHDKVNNHYLKLYGSATMFSLLSAAGQLSQAHHSGDKLTSQEMVYASIGQEMAQVSSGLIAKNLAIQPTIEIREGTHFNVMLAQDLILPDVYHFQNES